MRFAAALGAVVLVAWVGLSACPRVRVPGWYRSTCPLTPAHYASRRRQTLGELGLFI